MAFTLKMDIRENILKWAKIVKQAYLGKIRMTIDKFVSENVFLQVFLFEGKGVHI